MYVGMNSRLIRYLKYSICLLTSSTVLWYIYNTDFKGSQTLEEIEIGNSSESLAYNCCTPLDIEMKTNIFFLKTHKTGGTTVHNILLRFAERHSLDVMFPNAYMYYQPFSTSSLWPDMITPNNKYNILANHMRYTLELKLYQYPNTAMVTILRHPVTLFESLFHFYDVSSFIGMTFEQFLKAPNKPTMLQKSHEYRGYNQMSVDLGLDKNDFNNRTAIDKFIEKIDNEFDFVMIMEHMEASLILLANLMGWPLEYVVHLKKNARPDSNKYVLTVEDESPLLELNHVDVQLYYHFQKKFQKCVRQYGADKLNQQIMQLREMNVKFEKRCVAGVNTEERYGTINYLPKNASDWECNRALKLERDYVRHFRFAKKTKNSAV